MITCHLLATQIVFHPSIENGEKKFFKIKRYKYWGKLSEQNEHARKQLEKM
jgi:hypothetical protein